MLYKEGWELKKYAMEETSHIKHSRDFSDILKNDYLLRENTRRGVLVTGLRSTGKTIGVLMALKDFPSERMLFLAPSSKEEHLKTSQALSIVKEKSYDLIFIDEYSWLENDTIKHKGTPEKTDCLASYLAGKAQEGVKVILTGTYSTKIHALLNTEFIHRAVELNTTFFSYKEYCKLYELDKNDWSMKDFLTEGGIFENYACQTYGSMRDYIKTAIIENLGAYYEQYDKELIETAVYKIFYECICKSYIKKANEIPVYSAGKNELKYEDYLENFGIHSDIEIKPSVLKEIFYKLKEIGVVVVLDDIKLPNRKRAYITNQTLSSQLTKCIYELEELPERYFGDLFEASVVCYEYLQYAFDRNSPFEMYYAETRKSTLEIDFILCNNRYAYLFECKLNDNDDMNLNDTASILQDQVKNLLGDRELVGRYVIYQGKDKCIEQNGHTIIFTNNWDIDFENFQKNVEFLKNHIGDKPYE